MAAWNKPIHPHLFRGIAATAMVMDRPEQVLLARDLLGHANLHTTESHYLHAMTAGSSLPSAARGKTADSNIEPLISPASFLFACDLFPTVALLGS
jgi:hypothetical protein